MGLITAMRAQLPVAVPSAQPLPESGARQPPAGVAPAVAETTRKDAPQQAAATAATVTARLAERDEGAHPAAAARAASEAAREAYIRASLASGVSPLPLPKF